MKKYPKELNIKNAFTCLENHGRYEIYYTKCWLYVNGTK